MPEKTEKTQEMPLCEGKEILNKLQNIVNEIESPKKFSGTLIRSERCQCKKNKQLQPYKNIQKIRAVNKTPPQSFEIDRLINTEEVADEENKPDTVEEKKCDVPVDEPNKENLSEKPSNNKSERKESDSDDRRNVITVQKMCKGFCDEKDPPEIKALLKEGTLPPEDEKVCTKDTKTGTFTCYKVTKAGRIIKQITDPQPLPEERKVVPHPIVPIPHPSTNFELRGSKMYVGCDCLKRNGMQHDCPRNECQGKKECLKFPAPVCQPSGLAPPIIRISPISTSIEPDCGPRKIIQITNTEKEKRKVLLNYARAQYYQWPPSSRVPCTYHKKGLYYIRPLQKVAGVQTEDKLLDEYVSNELHKKPLTQLQEKKSTDKIKENSVEKVKQSKENILKEDATRKLNMDKKKNINIGKKQKTVASNKMEKSITKLTKDLNIK